MQGGRRGIDGTCVVDEVEDAEEVMAVECKEYAMDSKQLAKPSSLGRQPPNGVAGPSQREPIFLRFARRVCMFSFMSSVSDVDTPSADSCDPASTAHHALVVPIHKAHYALVYGALCDHLCPTDLCFSRS